MRFIDKWLPLIVCIREGHREPDEVEQLAAGFEPHFSRRQLYSVLNVSQLQSSSPSPRERLRIAEWANQGRVRKFSRELCVGTATVVAREADRHALTALQWLWAPASPHRAVRTVREGIGFCISSLVARGVRLPVSHETLLVGVERALRSEPIAGLDEVSLHQSAAAPRTYDSDLRLLSAADGWIRVGWVAPGVLWARVTGRLSMSLASTYIGQLTELLEGRQRVQFFVDSSTLESYDLAARDLTTSFLTARRRCFSLVLLLNWKGEMSPIGKASIDAFGGTFQLASGRAEFDAKLRLLAPLAAERIASALAPSAFDGGMRQV